MSFRSWLYVFALGISLSGSLQAQQQTQPTQDGAKQQESLSEGRLIGIPVRIVEGQKATEARESSEREGTQREKDDLVAQQRMADATEAMNDATQSMKNAAWLSFFAVALGTGLLIWTLLITRQANSAARGAVDVTRTIGEAQVRAYLSIQHISIAVKISNGLAVWSITTHAKNNGQSPAHGVQLVITDTSTGADNGELHVGDIGAGEGLPITYTITTPIKESELIGGKGDDLGARISILIKYRDVFIKEGVLGPVEYTVFGDRNVTGAGRAVSMTISNHRISAAQKDK